MLSNPVREYGPDFGKPMFYQIMADNNVLGNTLVHYSRVIRLDGVDLPYYQRFAENLWGQSVLERLWDRLLAFDSTTQGAAQLVYKAHLRTYSVDGLREIIAAGGQARQGLVAQIDFTRLMQSNEGITLMDAKDKFEAHTYTFSGLDTVLLQFAQQLSGALQIPLTRLFGQSPAGLNSTGESDMRNYYDGIMQQQERRLRAPLARMLHLTWRSIFGQDVPPGTNFNFRPLWVMSDEQKATIGNTVTQAVVQAESNGVIDRATALKELRQSSHITGLYTNINDEDIEEAENAPPPVPEGTEPADDESIEDNGSTTSDKRASRSWKDRLLKVFRDDDWKESDHPRDENGEFTSGGSGSALELGPHGPIFREHTGNWQAAVSRLVAEKTGEVPAALTHPSIEAADLIWGEEGKTSGKGFGLAKIAKWHPEVLGRLGEIYAGLPVVDRNENTIQLDDGRYHATVRRNWKGSPKTWLLTQFDRGEK
jgi:hypothetical protein